MESYKPQVEAATIVNTTATAAVSSYAKELLDLSPSTKSLKDTVIGTMLPMISSSSTEQENGQRERNETTTKYVLLLPLSRLWLALPPLPLCWQRKHQVCPSKSETVKEEKTVIVETTPTRMVRKKGHLDYQQVLF